MTKYGMAVGLGLLASFAVPAAGVAGAEEAADPWSAWIGCWQTVEEDGSSGQLVCVVPGEAPGSVRMLTVEDGAVAHEATLSADGAGRHVEDGGCAGTERAQWSRDGRRVFLTTQLDCDGVRRETTGVLGFVARDEWVDVQALRVGDQYASRTIRYRAAAAEDIPAAVLSELPTGRDLARDAARLHASAPLDLDGVMEASAAVDAAAVEAFLAEVGDGFDLDARTLVRLEEAGVAPSTIDVLVALSYPQAFAVRTPVRGDRAGDWATGARASRYCYDPFYAGMRYRAECAYYYGLRGYGYGMSWGYSPWGYDPYGWRYGRGPVVIVRPDRDDRDGASAVKGQGYTRGSNPATGRAQPRSGGGSNEGGARSSQPDRGSSTPRAQPSSAGSPDRSAPSRNDDSGRTARPRSGGGEQ